MVSKKMLKICESYAAEHDLIFNGAKSKLLIFNPQKVYERDPKLELNGELIPNVKSAVHASWKHPTCHQQSRMYR